MSDIYIALHFSTTCDHHDGFIPRDSTELIAFSYSIIEAQSLEILQKDTIYIRPANTPITPYCTSVTAITWDQVKDCGSFKDAVTEFDKVMQEKVISAGKDFSFVSMDIGKVRVQLPREARDKSVVLPSYLQHPRIFDLQNEYCKWQASHPEALSYTANSLTNILTALEVEVDKADLRLDNNSPTNSQEAQTPAVTQETQGDKKDKIPESEPKSKTAPNSSMIDVYTQLLIQLIKKSLPVEDHPSVLTKPYDSTHDVKSFLTERSKILYLSNLPFDTTQAELESWFTQYGARPIAFWTLKNTDAGNSQNNNHNSNNNGNKSKSKGVNGFAVFATHEEATESLSMNGRALNNRPVEIQPSSTTVLDKASELLTPFPPSKNRPRPGDWTCPSCGFSNFQRRTACFRCSFPASSAVTFQDQMHPNNGIHRRNNDHSNDNKATSMYHDHSQNHNNQYYSDHMNHSHQTHLNNNRNYNGGNSVPFRAGDWKCTNESCQYHNFAKNLVCLKCGINKPVNLQNNGHMNNKMNQMHSVSSTAAAIAAATASGQPLNLNNSYVVNQAQAQAQAQAHAQAHAAQAQNNQTNAAQKQYNLYTSSLSRSTSNTGAGQSSIPNVFQQPQQSQTMQAPLQTSLLSHPQQYMMMQPTDSQSPQLAPTTQPSISPVGEGNSSANTSVPVSASGSSSFTPQSSSSPGLYSFGYPQYRNGTDVNFASISNQFNSLNLNKN